MYVLGGPPASADPITGGQWEFLGPVAGLPSTQWAIDGTVAPLAGGLYFIYSGWPLERPDSDDDRTQQLFIVRMEGPTSAASAPSCISAPEHGWEFSDGKGINEGPQFLAAPDGRWTGLVYSCAGSWTKDYKMNTLQYLGGDPLDPRAWRKAARPLIEASPRGPWGPGHGSFIEVGGELVGVFHATDNEADGWANRRARVQRVVFTERGPSMGRSCGPHCGTWDQFLTGMGGGGHGHGGHGGFPGAHSGGGDGGGGGGGHSGLRQALKDMNPRGIMNGLKNEFKK